ncbi:hypothetical protein DFJ74DRAFT_683023 [Hyaloraphidium curvatum]|nr:hypothetical protein DFJ74DRAFT_683023 [Hyaloraphidium curvatum]
MPAVTPSGAGRPFANLPTLPKPGAGDATPPTEEELAAPVELPPAQEAAEQSTDDAANPPAGLMPPLLPAAHDIAARWNGLIDALRRSFPPHRDHGPCVLRGPRAGSAPNEPQRGGAFELLSLPPDILPLIFRYLFDCELARLSEASKDTYRACLPEFAFRVRRIETPEALRNVDRPRKTVVEEHKKMKILHMALAGSPVKHVVVCHRKGFPRATLNGCNVQ